MIYTKYIRDLGEKTKIPLRTLEAEWKIAQKQLDFDTMMDPNKYSHLRKMDGTFAEEVSRRVEKAVTQPEEASPEEKEVIPGEEAVEADLNMDKKLGNKSFPGNYYRGRKSRNSSR